MPGPGKSTPGASYSRARKQLESQGYTPTSDQDIVDILNKQGKYAAGNKSAETAAKPVKQPSVPSINITMSDLIIPRPGTMADTAIRKAQSTVSGAAREITPTFKGIRSFLDKYKRLLDALGGEYR